MNLGSVVVDTSSSSPFDTRELGAELSKLSIDLVDSPITQEKLHMIDDGGATLMVGTDSPKAMEKALPILKDMSSHVFPMGSLGAGHTMKTLNNYVSVGSIIALCDALVGLPLLNLQDTQSDKPGHWSEARPEPPNNDRRNERRYWCQLLNQILYEEPQILRHWLPARVTR